VHSRVHDFKETYLPRYQRWRNSTILLLLLLGAIVIGVLVAWRMTRPHHPRVEAISPAPDVPLLVPTSSDSGEPVQPPPAPSAPFNNALPTNPKAPPEDLKGPKR
jgi:hypothetical protein